MSLFDNIYIEKESLHYPLASNIVEKNSRNNGTRVIIDHYKDIFCLPKQNIELQKQSPSVIIATKKGQLFYKGSDACQNFGFDNFYYTSCVMNCSCNCDYCYLLGMYPSANICIFVNLQDYFEKLIEMLCKHDVYLCITYDTDLMPLENTLGYINKWCDFAKEVLQSKEKYKNNLTIEIRTKCPNMRLIKDTKFCPPKNVIFAISVNTSSIIKKYEHKTSPLNVRINAIKHLINKDCKVRICMDPLIYYKNWKNEYNQLIDEISNSIDINKIEAISLGSFRINQKYLKNIKNRCQNNPYAFYPFENINNFAQYPKKIQQEMTDCLYSKISKIYDENKVFVWK